VQVDHETGDQRFQQIQLALSRARLLVENAKRTKNIVRVVASSRRRAPASNRSPAPPPRILRPGDLTIGE